MKRKWAPFLTGFLVGFLLLAPVSQTFAQDAMSKDMKKDIHSLMTLMGVADMADQIMAQMVGQLKQMAPDAPEAFWTKFLEKANSDEFVELMIPVYGKYYSHEEIKQLIAFYKTPIGKKVTATLPAITQDSMAVGQQWGMKLGQQVMEELQKEGN